jgi:prepilin-type N-terminal cleavage/methylation domain-containing protein
MQHTLRTAREEGGFTLIELLIVIVILGVLSGVVVFSVGAFNNEGKASACAADAKALEIAREAYRAKNGGSYPSDNSALVPDYLKQLPNTTGCP